MLAMLAAGTSLKAQEVTVTLSPGWTWIGCPTTEAMDFATALGDFTPMQGDIIKSQWGQATYINGQWRGGISQFYPGYGYHYKSSRMVPITVTFNAQPPLQVTVITATPTDITTYGMTCGGTVTDQGDSQIIVRGVCWSNAANPTIADPHTTNGYGAGSFSSLVEGLQMNTTYYVRAYVVTANGTAYGNEVSFQTEMAQTWQNGILPGQFSVSATHQVQFSQGNLQYQGATGTWRFAANQWECLGTTTGQNSNAQDVDRDLFGWGTSGWNNGNLYYQPYDTDRSTDGDIGYGYGPTDGTFYDYYLTGDYANADWGAYNAILNGGNQTNQWRTLTRAEWNYVLDDRTTSSGIRYAKAQVCGVDGVLLLPDDWDASLYVLNSTNSTQAPFNSNVIADADWATMETNGAVFLPAAGYRQGTYVYTGGYYWASSNSTSSNSYSLSFYGSTLNTYSRSRNYGQSVRLVSVTLPEVSTGTVIDVLDNTARVGGNLIDGGNVDMMVCGICCSTNHDPTTNDIVAIAPSAAIGEFMAILNGLTPNTTYYARAFATNNSGGTSYGEEISFTTIEEASPSWTNGILPGGFSISATQQVQFSQGNLQYIGSASTPYWKFAEHQWDYLGKNGQGSAKQDVDRDLFGWGTSGYDHGANCYQPWSTSQTNSDYQAYGCFTCNLSDSTGMADWGCNPISNGGNQPNQWRTLSKEEWTYIINTRVTASGIRYAKAQVFGVNGVILLPDDWSASYYSLNSTNSNGADFSQNVITASGWNTLEQHGAVFLPAAGYRRETTVYSVGNTGIYWSTSCNTTSTNYSAYNLYFYNLTLSPENYNLAYNCGQSVRLVRDIPPHAYVDLGLPSGTLWATCNVGAMTPEAYGDYFSWGTTQPRSNFSWGNYPYSNGSSSELIKYCNDANYGYEGFTDSLTILLPEDDAAMARWGAEWRMPTWDEWQELYQNTTHYWTTQNGVYGRLFTASNGNSLFLPAAGYRYSNSLYDAGNTGYYWSSSLYTSNPVYAWQFYFYSGTYSTHYNGYRPYGRPVRAERSSQN